MGGNFRDLPYKQNVVAGSGGKYKYFTSEKYIFDVTRASTDSYALVMIKSSKEAFKVPAQNEAGDLFALGILQRPRGVDVVILDNSNPETPKVSFATLAKCLSLRICKDVDDVPLLTRLKVT
jgi:hypothetical protein